MIIGNEVKYLTNSTMDHREWYVSLGYDSNLFEQVIRGYVIDNKIIYFKGSTFSYDEEVIKAAKMYTPAIRYSLQNPTLEVYCGMIVVGGYGGKFEPVVKINENEITGIQSSPVVEKKDNNINVENSPAIEFKNNYDDPKFIKIASIVTSICLVLLILIKIYIYFSEKNVQVVSPFTIIWSILQVGLLGFTIYGYLKKKNYTKYLGLIASISIILSLDILDIILGILYLVFSIDAGYFVRIFNKIKK